MSTQTSRVEPRHYSPSASVVNTDSRWIMPMIVVLALLAGLSISMSISLQRDVERKEREARMLEYYVLELDAKLIAAGIKTSDDAFSKKLRKADQ